LETKLIGTLKVWKIIKLKNTKVYENIFLEIKNIIEWKKDLLENN
jgi:hypothetical protein